MTCSFTLDVYGDKPDWVKNVDAARNAGGTVARAVEDVASEKAEELRSFDSLIAAKEQKPPTLESKATENM